MPMLRDTFVRPFYLGLLHGNLIHFDKYKISAFSTELQAAATSISDEQLGHLLNLSWHGRLCAGWFIGLTKRASFVRLIGEMLLASESVFAGQGYCVALGLIDDKECARLLHAYLRTYLPPNGRFYDQDWAIGALAHIEGSPPREYLRQELWRDGDQIIDPAQGIETFQEIVAYLRQYRMIERT